MTSSLLRAAETFGVRADGSLSSGLPAARRSRNHSRVLEAASLFTGVRNGDPMAPLLVHEALSTSDLFKSAAGDVFDREMLAQYAAMPIQWTKFAARTTLRDFRPKRLTELSGGRVRLERVPELSEYPSADYTLAERVISVAKYGRRFGYSFEAKINDQLDELMQVPNEFAGSATLTEDFNALTQLVNPATGAPNTGFFKAGNANIGSGALTEVNVQAAIVGVSSKKDASGNLLYPGPLQLVVGPALKFKAARLFAQTQIRVPVDPAAPTGAVTYEPNPLAGAATLTVLDNLPGTAWFILPLPSAPRPAFYSAFLRGYETPDIRYKNDQGARAGGGSIGADEGDFDTDAVYWRVRHIHGAAQGDPMFTWASDGTGA